MNEPIHGVSYADGSFFKAADGRSILNFCGRDYDALWVALAEPEFLANPERSGWRRVGYFLINGKVVS